MYILLLLCPSPSIHFIFVLMSYFLFFTSCSSSCFALLCSRDTSAATKRTHDSLSLFLIFFSFIYLFIAPLIPFYSLFVRSVNWLWFDSFVFARISVIGLSYVKHVAAFDRGRSTARHCEHWHQHKSREHGNRVLRSLQNTTQWTCRCNVDTCPCLILRTMTCQLTLTSLFTACGASTQTERKRRDFRAKITAIFATNGTTQNLMDSNKLRSWPSRQEQMKLFFCFQKIAGQFVEMRTDVSVR